MANGYLADFEAKPDFFSVKEPCSYLLVVDGSRSDDAPAKFIAPVEINAFVAHPMPPSKWRKLWLDTTKRSGFTSLQVGPRPSAPSEIEKTTT